MDTENGVSRASQTQVCKQEERLKETLIQITNAHQFSSNILVAWDANLDFLEGNPEREDTRSMKELLIEFMEDASFSIHNTEATRHWPGTRSSLIDHFMSNCPNYIDNIKTKHSCVADHDMVGLLYHANIIQDNPSFLNIHDWSN